jgi:hypothetical protein
MRQADNPPKEQKPSIGSCVLLCGMQAIYRSAVYPVSLGNTSSAGVANLNKLSKVSINR